MPACFVRVVLLHVYVSPVKHARGGPEAGIALLIAGTARMNRATQGNRMPHDYQILAKQASVNEVRFFAL